VSTRNACSTKVVFLSTVCLFDLLDSGDLFFPLTCNQGKHFFVVFFLFVLRILGGFLHEGGRFAVKKLESRQVLHDVSEKRHFIFTARIIFETELLEAVQLAQIVLLVRPNLDSVVGKKQFFEFAHLGNSLYGLDEIGLEVEFCQTGKRVHIFHFDNLIVAQVENADRVEETESFYFAQFIGVQIQNLQLN